MSSLSDDRVQLYLSTLVALGMIINPNVLEPQTAIARTAHSGRISHQVSLGSPVFAFHVKTKNSTRTPYIRYSPSPEVDISEFIVRRTLFGKVDEASRFARFEETKRDASFTLFSLFSELNSVRRLYW